MTNEPIHIRTARPDDAEALLGIYAPYVENTTVTFECRVPTAAEFAGRISYILQTYPYLAALCGGEMLGYAYAAPFREREAYIWAAEASIYVRQDMHRRGIGRLLYTELERILAAQHIVSIEACISSPNRESIKFHSSLGFKRAAHFSKCAYKHGQWIDITCMQKLITEPCGAPEPFLPFSELPDEIKNM